jgi:hypothetical protein
MDYNSQSPYNIRSTERSSIPTIEKLAETIDNGAEGKTWCEIWETHQATIGTLSLRSGYPTGRVLAEIMDIINDRQY